MHLQIAEFKSLGHHLVHVRKLVDAALPFADKITLSLSRDARSSPDFAAQLGDLPDTVDLDTDNPSADMTRGYLRAGLAYCQNLKKAVHRVRPDYFWMPTADIVTQASALLGLLGSIVVPPSVPSECILHRCAPAYWTESRIRNAKLAIVSRLLKKSHWTRLHLVDRLAYEWAISAGGFKPEICFLPDPIDAVERVDRDSARRRLGLPESGWYAAVVGALDLHKGIDHFARAVRLLRHEDDVRFLIVGHTTPDVARLLREIAADPQLGPRLHWTNRFVSDEEFNLALSAADLVCTPSVDHIGISNSLLRAVAAGRPVLGCRTGWQGRVIPDLELGWTCDVRDPIAFSRALREALEASRAHQTSPGARRVCKFHDPLNYAAWVTTGLRRASDRSESGERLDWNWVLTGDRA